MDIPASVGTSIVERAATAATDSIWRQIRYVLDYKDNLQGLNSKVEALKHARTRVLHEVEAARKRLEEIEDDVESWLMNVEEEISNAEKILEDDRAARKNCCAGLLPNVRTRHKFGRSAKLQSLEVENLAGKGTFDRVGNLLRPKGLVPSKSFEAFESRKGSFESVMGKLKDPGVNMVGIWGLRGIGKTTLAKKVAEQLQADGVFETVVTTNVTEDPDMKKIQTDIAEWLKFELEAESVEVRASMLHERLKQEKSVLVILDNVWKKLELEEVGIPMGLHDKYACKILITSRNEKVLHQMGAGAESCFRLDQLNEEEARNLFDKNVGKIEDPEIRSVATEIVRKCAGLPVIILPVAAALKNRSLSDWKVALDRLKQIDAEEDMTAKTYAALDLSYNYLSKEAKYLFLLCGKLAPYYINVRHLLKYSFGLGLFEQCKTVSATRNRLLKEINDLKSSSLLLEGNGDESHKMHDIVHGFARDILSKYHHTLAVTYGGTLEGWPVRETLQNLAAIFLLFCNIPELPPMLECQKLVSFTLCSNKSLKIPDKFFASMEELKLLDLAYVDLSPLPSSLEFLKNLQTLYLWGCIVEDIRMIGELINLQYLTLGNINIVQLPKEIEKLARLQLLHLLNCKRLELIPPNVLSCLTNLELFSTEGSGVLRWGRGNNAKLAELKSLPKLTSLNIHITDWKIIPRDLFSEKLEFFAVCIGDDGAWPGRFGGSRRLKLKLDRSIRQVDQVDKVRLLIKRTEDLYLDELRGNHKDLRELDSEGFVNLKRLHMQNCHEIRFIIMNSTWADPHNAFLRLESLHIENARDLEQISSGPSTRESLGNLRVLKVVSCDSLKNFFSVQNASIVSRLEQIKVIDCETMEVIFIKESNGGKEEAIEFTQMRKLILQCLPKLKSFCSAKLNSTQSTPILATASSSKHLAINNSSNFSFPLFGEKILFPNLEELKLSSIKVQKIWNGQCPEFFWTTKKLTRLVVRDCQNLKFLFSSSMVESLSQLKSLEVTDCKSLVEIVCLEAHEKEKRMDKALFPNLEFLNLNRLQELITICTGESILDCPKLKELWIVDCPGMKNFISSLLSYGDMAINNSTRNISAVSDKKIGFCNLEGPSTRQEIIWHNKQVEMPSYGQTLTTLLVEGCDHLIYLFNPSIVVCLVQLRRLEICDCKFMEKVVVTGICGHQEDEMMCTVMFSKLNLLRIKDLPQLTRFCIGASIECPFLRELFIENCPKVEQFVSRPVGTNVVSSQEAIMRNLALFDAKVLLPSLEKLVLSFLDNLKLIWHHDIHFDSFSNLRTLSVSHCEQLLKVFPSNMLSKFQNVEELSLNKCDALEEVFDVQELASAEDLGVAMAFRLKFLKIEDLHGLKKIWNEDPKGLFDLQNLQIVHIEACQNLRAVFPCSVAEGLQKLERVFLEECGVENIVAKDGGNKEKIEFVFTKVKLWQIFGLPQLKGFYPGVHTLEFPMLERLSISECPKIEIFSSKPEDSQEVSADSHQEILSQQSLFSFEKESGYGSCETCPNLEELSLRSKDAMRICQSSSSPKSFHKVMTLRLECVHDSSSNFPFEVLQRFAKVNFIILRNCNHFKELFRSGDMNEKNNVSTLERIRSLSLWCLPNLRLLWNQETPVAQVLLNLKNLYLGQCDSLLHLEPSLASLPNLTYLKIWRCEGLVKIMRFSTAKSLVQLETMQIEECSTVTEIVSNEGDESKGCIIFRKLKTLTLKSLTNLSNFCSVHCTIKIPNLEEVKVIQCHEMKAFSQGNVITPKLESVMFTERTDKQQWQHDLNTTIHQWYKKMNVERLGADDPSRSAG